MGLKMGWKASRAIDFIIEFLPKGKTVLELGSGTGTKRLVEHFTVYSVEDMKKIIGKYKSNYIYSPIRLYNSEYVAPDIPGSTGKGILTPRQMGWYDYEILEKELPSHYDFLFIDGPVGKIGRAGFLKHLDLFDTSVPMIMDDIHRVPERKLLDAVAEKLNLKFEIIDCKRGAMALFNI